MPARNFYQKKPAHLRFGTIDIGTLTGCSRELAQVLKKRNIDIACVQECKWTGSKAAENGEGYKLFYCGERATKNGVAIALSKHLLQSPYKIERTSD